MYFSIVKMIIYSIVKMIIYLKYKYVLFYSKNDYMQTVSRAEITIDRYKSVLVSIAKMIKHVLFHRKNNYILYTWNDYIYAVQVCTVL